MAKTLTASEAKDGPDAGLLSAAEKRALVQKVTDSGMFRRSSALCAFLLYITEKEILGQADELKEHTIGVEVLGRRPDYIPGSDNIVRVRAHELRGRLERYFASEGADEPVILTMPTGSYVPRYVAREAHAPNRAVQEPDRETPVLSREVLPPLMPETETDIALSGSDEERPRRYPWRLIAAAGLVVLFASVVLVGYAPRIGARAGMARRSEAMRDFWGQFFDKQNEELKVVYADPGFAFWQDLNKQSLSLGDYLNRKYLNTGEDKVLQNAVRRAASPADIETVGELGTIAGQFGGQVNVQFARDVSTKFFRQGDLILLGSRRSNPWVEMYEPSLNFKLEVDPQTGAALFRNPSPRPGEAATFAAPSTSDGAASNDRQYISYGVAALLRGCGDRGLTVLAEGLSTQSTKAVGDVLTDPERLGTLLKSMGHKPGTKVAPFEALIQITSLPNTEYDNPKVIAYRLQPATSCVGD